MKRLLAGIVVVGALFAISPALASADTATATCSPSDCGTWQQGPVAINWTDPGFDTSACPSSDSTETSVADKSTGTAITCSDGNPAGDGVVFVKIDNTAPTVTGATSRAADFNGWFNHPVTFTFTGTDALSGVAGCDTPTYSGPNSQTATVSGTCTDNANNQSALASSAQFKYDSAAPGGVSGAPTTAPNPNSNGWYNGSVIVAFTSAAPGVSGISSCESLPYSGPDSAAAHVSGTCTSGAGIASAAVQSAPFKVDVTPPTVTGALPNRSPDSNGWYNHPVALTFGGIDATSGIGTCDTVTYSGPSTGAAKATGACTDKAGNVSAPGQSAAFKYDSVPPEITGANASRAPDYNGWYNHPVSFTFTGADGVSGIAAGSCSTVTYSGGDSSKATVKGSCRDVAGNTGTGSQTFKYDSTPPGKATLKAVPGNHTIDLSWSLPSDATGVTVLRSPQSSAAAPATVYRGTASAFTDKKLTNGVKYRYTVIDNDQAGNTNTQTIVIAPTASSLRPLVGAIVSSAPFLSWKKVKKATYYNLQLYRGSKKVLSIWPHKHYLQVGKKWRYLGKKYTLKKGHYRWYVWPGFGAEKRHKYGKLLGASTFRVI